MFKFVCLSVHNSVTSVQGRIQELVQGGLKLCSFQGGAQHPLEPDNPLKLIDFTGPGGFLAPIAHPEYASASVSVFVSNNIVWDLRVPREGL